MKKVPKKRAIVMPTLNEDKAITIAANNDPDALPLTTKQLQAMISHRSLRGRPKLKDKKLLVSIRYSPAVVEYFKATGEGWQTRIDTVLQEYVAGRSRRFSGK